MRSMATRASSAAPRTLVALHYVFAASTAEELAVLRAPHRGAHLAHAAAWAKDGRLLLGGALGGEGAPVGLLVFQGVSVREVEEFAVADPYVQKRVVVSHTVRPWAVVVEADSPGRE
jgi:uncharacterized protein YciI